MSTPDTTFSAPTAARGGRASGALLKLQADERLVAHVRRGNEAAFEVLVQRYHTRLLAFCRHMLGSGARRDAEDVLQEVFTSAYRAMLGDTRPINVRPWLYRIARNRCLNHLRRDPMPSIEGMELTVVDERIGTAETVHQRAEVRQLLSDIQNLPETQRTAILLREIDDLSYEQIAMAMDNTVASVKSLLVRARVGLAEAAESRRLSCDEVRFELGQHAEGLVDKLTPPTRRHLKECKSCAAFQQDLKDTNKALAMLAPAFGLVVLLKTILAPLGGAGHAGTGAAGAGAAGAAGAAGGGIISIGGVISAKTMTGLAAAVAVTGAAVEVKHVATPQRPAAVTQQATATKPVAPLAPAGTNPSGGAPLAATSPTGAAAADRPAPTTADDRDKPAETTPATTVTVAIGTTPEATPTTVALPGTTSTTPEIETRTGTETLPDVEDRSDTTTTVHTPIKLPVPVPPSLRPTAPATPAPTPEPAPAPTAAPAPAATPAPTPASTPAPTPEPTPPASVLEPVIDVVAPTTGG